MASLLRVDAVPRAVVAARRQSAQPSAHPFDGWRPLSQCHRAIAKGALTGGTMKHLLITPRPGTAEAEGAGQQYPDSEMVLALPPKTSQPAPFKNIAVSGGAQPPVLDVLAIGGGHGGVRALFDQTGIGNFSAAYWKQAVVDALVARGVKAKLVVLDACLTASMFDVFASLCIPKGRIIASMYSINGRPPDPGGLAGDFRRRG